eukprot:scaffold163343_cov27-Tisochrysis_lutea.AAC.3
MRLHISCSHRRDQTTGGGTHSSSLLVDDLPAVGGTAPRLPRRARSLCMSSAALLAATAITSIADVADSTADG